MGQTVRSWWERAGLDLRLGWVILVGLILLALQWGGFQRDSDEQKQLVATVAALNTAMAAEQEARKLLEQKHESLESRGAERTARRDADIAALNGRLSTAEGKLATLQIEIAAKLAELITDVRAIKEKLANTRAAATVPNRAG